MVDLGQLSLHGRLTGAIAIGVGSWVALAPRIRRATLTRRGSAVLLCVAIGALALSMTFQVLAPVIDDTTGVPNLGRFASNSAVLVTAWASELLLLHVRHGHRPRPGAVRRRRFQLAGVLTGMAVLFATTPPNPATAIGDPRHFSVTYFSPYVYLYAAYLGALLAFAAGTLVRLIRGAAERLFQVSLAISLAGSVTGICYAVCKAVYLVSYQLAGPLPMASEGPIGRTLYQVSAAAFLVGVSTPTLGRGLAAAGRWCLRYQQYQQLFPLWRVLYAAMPSIAIDPRPTRKSSLLTIRNLSFHLYRRVIEIRDGQLLLRPFGLRATDEPHDPATAAGAVRAALAAQAAGRERPAVDADVPPAPRRDLAAEIRWLAEVSTAYRRADRRRSDPDAG